MTPGRGSEEVPGFESVAQAFFQYAESTEALVHVCHESFALATRQPEILRTLSEGDDSGRGSAALAKAEHVSKFAAMERDAGFPRLHAHSLLGLWGALEAFVEDTTIAALAAEPELLAEPQFAKFKLRVALLDAERSEQLRAIVGDLQLQTSERRGPAHFEAVLASVHLSGRTPERIRRAIFEAQQLRHIWAHRAGIADSVFVSRCPQLGFAVNDRADLGASVFLDLMHGMHMYAVVVINRTRALAGGKPLDVCCVGYENVLDELTSARPPTPT